MSPIDWGRWVGDLAGRAHSPGQYAACEGAIDERESFIDGTFVAAKGGGEAVGLTKRCKSVKILAIVDRHGLPLSVSTHAANQHEVTLLQLSYLLEGGPERLLGD